MEKIAVEDLEIGMFVDDLDVPWIETPYLIQGILIQSQDDIDELHKHCQFVYVSPEKSDANIKPLLSVRQQTSKSDKSRKYFGNTVYSDVRSTTEELPEASDAEHLAEDLMESLRSNMEKNSKLELTTARELVSVLTDSMIRNPDAMLLLRQLKSEHQDQYARAINIAAYIIAFGRHLCLPKNELSELGMGGLLMDIGLMQSPKIKRQQPDHVHMAKELLSAYEHIPERVLDVVMQHHERENGSGFPEGLRGNQITPYGRMAAIVDSYELLLHGSDDDPPMAQNAFEAFTVLKDWSRAWLNGTLVREFTCCMGLFPPGSLVELNTGEFGIVLGHSRTQRFLPYLMIIRNADGTLSNPPRTLDLRNDPDSARLHQILRELDYKEQGIDPSAYFMN